MNRDEFCAMLECFESRIREVLESVFGVGMMTAWGPFSGSMPSGGWYGCLCQFVCGGRDREDNLLVYMRNNRKGAMRKYNRVMSVLGISWEELGSGMPMKDSEDWPDDTFMRLYDLAVSKVIGVEVTNCAYYNMRRLRDSTVWEYQLVDYRREGGFSCIDHPKTVKECEWCLSVRIRELKKDEVELAGSPLCPR